MDEIALQLGVDKAVDALLGRRLALFCGAGLSMAAPSSLPSAAALASKAKQKYDATYGASRAPLPDTIEDQAEFFFQRGELSTIYLSTYIDHDAFSAKPNKGHFAAADLLLTGAFDTAVSTNVDALIETAGNMLFGQIGAGVNRDRVASLPPEVSPLLKIHGCWSDPPGTVWTAGQDASGGIRSRTEECGAWLASRLLNRDIIIVGYWTDWDYLNRVLEVALDAVNPSRVIVVDPCDTSSFRNKAPSLFDLGERASHEFCHVRCSGDAFLDKLRVDFSRSFIRRVLHAGADSYAVQCGAPPDAAWLEPISTEAEVLWCIRRDLEGRKPNEPAKERTPIEDPLLGMTLLQLQARGAVADGPYWNLDGERVRVLRTPNHPLHKVEADFANEIAPVVAPKYVIAVGAEALNLPSSITRGASTGSIARGTTGRWLSRSDAVVELSL
ncbi:MAG: hypothetical protein ABJP11_11945 [Hyphomicrobiales bacterium]